MFSKFIKQTISIFMAENNDLRREIEAMFSQNGVRIYE